MSYFLGIISFSQLLLPSNLYRAFELELACRSGASSANFKILLFFYQDTFRVLVFLWRVCLFPCQLHKD